MQNTKKSKSENGKNILKIIGIILIGIIFLVLFLYFITSYKSTVIYSVSLDNEKFTLKSGLFVKSKMYNVLDLGQLEMKNDEYERDNFYIELYLGDKFVIGMNSKDGLEPEIIERYGYNESFTTESLKHIEDNFKIKIYVHKDYENRKDGVCSATDLDCEVYEYTLEVDEIFRNDKLIYLEGSSI